MKNHLFNKRIPTVFGIGFVILGVVLTTIVANNQTGLKSKASNSEEPQNIKVSNLSDKSFTITYQTDAAVTGSVNYGRDKNLGNTELEDLDREKRNVFLTDGNPPSEALVYLSTQNSQLLSSSTAKNGEFDFPLKSLRSENLSSYINLNENTILKLVVISNDSLKSTALVSLNKKDSIPTITLPNDYDFTNDLVPIASKSAESKSLGFPTIVPKQTNLKLQILTPKKNQSFTDRKPQFRGTSLPNEKVEITIHSDEKITTTGTAGSNGNWTYEPPANLSAR